MLLRFTDLVPRWMGNCLINRTTSGRTNQEKNQLTPFNYILKGQQNHYVSKDTGNTWSVLPGYKSSRMVFSSPREGIYFSQGKVHHSDSETPGLKIADEPADMAIAIFPNGNMTARMASILLLLIHQPGRPIFLEIMIRLIVG